MADLGGASLSQASWPVGWLCYCSNLFIMGSQASQASSYTMLSQYPKSLQLQALCLEEKEAPEAMSSRRIMAGVPAGGPQSSL